MAAAQDDGGLHVAPLLEAHPALVERLRHMLGPRVRNGTAPPADYRGLNGFTAAEFKTDLRPRTVEPDATVRLRGGEWAADGHRLSARSYAAWAGQRMCNAVRVFWALHPQDAGSGADGGRGLGLANGSHNSQCPPPEGFDAAEVVYFPRLDAGDLIISASSLSYVYSGVDRGAVIVAEYVEASLQLSRPVRQEEEGKPEPEWVGLLSPTQRAMLGWGEAGATVLSDGERTWLSPPNAPPTHPAAWLPADGDSGGSEVTIDPAEAYCWDCQGHLILRNVMDDEWVDECMRAIESHPDYATLSGPRPPREEWLQQWLGHEEDFDAETSDSPFAGAPEVNLEGLLALPPPLGDSIRRLIDCPAVVSRLRWMLGSHLGLIDGVRLIGTQQGDAGSILHSGGAPLSPHSLVGNRNGRLHADYIK